MKLEEFKGSLIQSSPPEGLNDLLKAMWYDRKGDWAKAHDIAQDVNNWKGAWVHAYLHRKEGDNSNASYWYQRAGKIMPEITLEKEWEELSEALIKL